MKIQTKDLVGAALDWAVAKCEGVPIRHDPMGFKTGSEAGYWVWDDAPKGMQAKIGRGYAPSTAGLLGITIVEREGIALRQHSNGKWFAMLSSDLGNTTSASWVERTARGGERYGPFSYQISKRQQRFDGPTLRIAAMRCYVASKLGEVVDVPNGFKGDSQ